MNSSSLHFSTEPIPEPEWAWFARCCDIMGKSPMFIPVLFDSHREGSFCWTCTLANGLSPEEAVFAFRHYTGRKKPVDSSREYFPLNVQTEYSRA